MIRSWLPARLILSSWWELIALRYQTNDAKNFEDKHDWKKVSDSWKTATKHSIKKLSRLFHALPWLWPDCEITLFRSPSWASMIPSLSMNPMKHENHRNLEMDTSLLFYRLEVGVPLGPDRRGGSPPEFGGSLGKIKPPFLADFSTAVNSKG